MTWPNLGSCWLCRASWVVCLLHLTASGQARDPQPCASLWGPREHQHLSMSHGTFAQLCPISSFMLSLHFCGKLVHSSAFRFLLRITTTLPDTLLHFQFRARKACNHVWPVASLHFLAFPPSHSNTGWKQQSSHFYGFVKSLPYRVDWVCRERLLFW